MARHETQLSLDGYWHEEVRRSDPDARGNTTDIEYIYTRNRSDRGLELINDDFWWWLKRNSERVFNDAKAAQDRNTEVTLMWGGSPRSSVGTPTRSPSAPPAPGRCGRCEPLSSTASPSSSGSAGQNLLEVFRRRCGDRNCCGGGRSNWCRPTGDRNRKERRAMAVICAGRFSEWPHGWEQNVSVQRQGASEMIPASLQSYCHKGHSRRGGPNTLLALTISTRFAYASICWIMGPSLSPA